MSDLNSPVNTVVEDDPKRPYKAYVALLLPLLVAGVLELVDNFLLAAGDTVPLWLRIVLMAISSGAGAYSTTNPKVVR